MTAYSPRGRITAAVATLIFLIGAVVYIAVTPLETRWDFRNNLWGPTHLLVTGRSPYLVERFFGTEGSPNAVWMPTVIGALFPLGWLSEQHATNLWTVLNIALFVAVIGLSLPRRPSPLLLALGGLAMLLFPPFLSVLTLGQYGIVAAFLLLVAVRCIDPPRYLAVGFLVAVAVAKPQLVVLPVIGLALAFYRGYGLKGAARFVFASGVAALLLTIPLWIGYPDWLTGFQIALGRNPTWAQPSLFYILQAGLGVDAGRILWGIVALAALGVNTWLWLRQPPLDALVWSLALNTLITPYVWTWDFVLLVPLFVRALFAVRQSWSRYTLLLLYVALWIGMVTVRVTTDNSDWRFWWVTPVLIGGIALLTTAVSRQSQRVIASTSV